MGRGALARDHCGFELLGDRLCDAAYVGQHIVVAKTQNLEAGLGQVRISLCIERFAPIFAVRIAIDFDDQA